jgi:hypothetical protein
MKIWEEEKKVNDILSYLSDMKPYQNEEDIFIRQDKIGKNINCILNEIYNHKELMITTLRDKVLGEILVKVFEEETRLVGICYINKLFEENEINIKIGE